MKVLFVAYLADRSASGRQRLGAFESLGHQLTPFSLDGYDTQRGLRARLRHRLLGRPFRRDDLTRMGERFVASVAALQPDLVWAEKPLMLLPEQLARARDVSPRTQFVCFQDDDPFGLRRSERHIWRHFIDCIPLYDVHLVKKPVDITEFTRHGAQEVQLFMHGVYAPIFHPPTAPSVPEHDVVFVGTPLDHRVAYIEQLLSRHHIPLQVYGNSWRRTLPYWRHRAQFFPEVVGDTYAELLRRSKICLGFVSSSNRDEYSMRSFEIPGCGAFMLAERTATHQALFEEGKEAEFFASIEECADKCLFYLGNEGARERIAAQGYERCRKSGYFLEHRIEEALMQLSPVPSRVSAAR